MVESWSENEADGARWHSGGGKREGVGVLCEKQNSTSTICFFVFIFANYQFIPNMGRGLLALTY